MGDPTPSTQSKYYSFNSCIALLQEEETEIHENDNVNVFLYIYLHIAREVSEDLLRNLKLTCQHAVLFLFYMCSCVTCLSMMVFSEGVCVRMLKWRCCPQEWNGSREDFTWWTSESIKGNAMLLILFFFVNSLLIYIFIICQMFFFYTVLIKYKLRFTWNCWICCFVTKYDTITVLLISGC